MSGSRLSLTLCVTKARKGSEEDMDALKRMFHHLKFESTMKSNPTAEVLSCQLQGSRKGGWTRKVALGQLSEPAHSSPSKQFLEELDKFQQTIDDWEEPVSCAFVVLMAHGEEGLLEGEDEKMVRLEDLFEVLNNKNCKALRGKPKVYIIQACRGGEDGDTASLFFREKVLRQSLTMYPRLTWNSLRSPCWPQIYDLLALVPQVLRL